MIRHTARIFNRCLSSLVLVASASVAGEIDINKLQASCPGVVSWLSKSQPSVRLSPSRPISQPELCLQLLELEREDQNARKELSPDSEEKVRQLETQVDMKHLPILRKIVETTGVPKPDAIDKDGVQAFWTLVQHASGDVSLQKRVLHSFQTSNYGVAPDEIAALSDKIRIAEHRLQLYGSQFHLEKNRLVANPIEDAANVDDRRRKFGLTPIADYRCMLEVMYNLPIDRWATNMKLNS